MTGGGWSWAQSHSLLPLQCPSALCLLARLLPAGGGAGEAVGGCGAGEAEVGPSPRPSSAPGPVGLQSSLAQCFLGVFSPGACQLSGPHMTFKTVEKEPLLENVASSCCLNTAQGRACLPASLPRPAAHPWGSKPDMQPLAWSLGIWFYCPSIIIAVPPLLSPARNEHLLISGKTQKPHVVLWQLSPPPHPRQPDTL